MSRPYRDSYRMAIPRQELLPNVVSREIAGTVTINSWRMRGPERTLAKPAGTYRIALLGASQVFGTGINDAEVLDVRLQERLSRLAPAGRRVEVLNFSVPRAAIVDRLARFEDLVVPFQPDLVLFAVNWREPRWQTEDLRALTNGGADLRYDELRAILVRHRAMVASGPGTPVPFGVLRDLLRRAGLQVRKPGTEQWIRVRVASDDVIDWALRRVVEGATRLGAPVLMVGVDLVSEQPPESPEILDAGHRAGMGVIDLFGLYDREDRAALRLAPWNDHPNARAHRLMADRLYGELVRRCDTLDLPGCARTDAPR